MVIFDYFVRRRGTASTLPLLMLLAIGIANPGAAHANRRGSPRGGQRAPSIKVVVSPLKAVWHPEFRGARQDIEKKLKVTAQLDKSDRMYKKLLGRFLGVGAGLMMFGTVVKDVPVIGIGVVVGGIAGHSLVKREQHDRAAILQQLVGPVRESLKEDVAKAAREGNPVAGAALPATEGDTDDLPELYQVARSAAVETTLSEETFQALLPYLPPGRFGKP